MRALLGILALALAAGAWYFLRPETIEPVRPLRPQSMDAVVAEQIEKYVQAVEEQPGSAQRHGELGLAYYSNSLWTEALSSFENATRLEDAEPLWPYRAAMATAREGDLLASIATLESVTERFPFYAPAHHRLGAYLLETGDSQRAESHFREAIRLRPDAFPGHVGQAQVHLQRGEYALAEKELRRSLELEPNDKMSHNLLASALRGLGRAEQAEREALLGVGAQPQFLPDAGAALALRLGSSLANQLERATALIEAGRLDEAIVLLERTRAQRPDNTSVLNNLSVAYKNQNRLEDSVAVLREAIRLDATSAPQHLNLAETLISMNRLEEGLESARRCTTVDPTFHRGYFAEGRALMFLNRYEEARLALKRSIEISTEDPSVYYTLGEACYRLDRIPEAYENFKETTRRLPDYLPAQVNLAYSALRLDRFMEAADAYEQAFTLNPQHPNVQKLGQRLRDLRDQ